MKIKLNNNNEKTFCHPLHEVKCFFLATKARLSTLSQSLRFMTKYQKRVRACEFAWGGGATPRLPHQNINKTK